MGLAGLVNTHSYDNWRLAARAEYMDWTGSRPLTGASELAVRAWKPRMVS